MKTENTIIINETPMREEYFISDQNMISLIKDLFKITDQPWEDTKAFEMSVAIDNWVKNVT